jgi:hypothetical protein
MLDFSRQRKTVFFVFIINTLIVQSIILKPTFTFYFEHYKISLKRENILDMFELPYYYKWFCPMAVLHTHLILSILLCVFPLLPKTLTRGNNLINLTILIFCTNEGWTVSVDHRNQKKPKSF